MTSFKDGRPPINTPLKLLEAACQQLTAALDACGDTEGLQLVIARKNGQHEISVRFAWPSPPLVVFER